VRLHVQRGVSLIEVMIGLVIVSIVLALGVPSFSTYIQNTRIRNDAEAIQNGLNLARAEAVRRNTLVKFTLGTGSAWTIGCSSAVGDQDGDGVDDCPATIQSYVSEGSTRATVATSEVNGATGAAGGSTFSSTLEFNGLGRVTSATLDTGDNARFDVSNPAGGSCVASGGSMRCLRVVVSAVGQVRMCDPALASTDAQGC